MVTAVVSLLGVVLPLAAGAAEARLRPADGAAFDPCGMCELPDSAPEEASVWPAWPSAADLREVCADAAESYDLRDLAACEEEAERALRALREAGIPWGESELPDDGAPGGPEGPLCRDASSCGPPPSAPVLRAPLVERAGLSPVSTRVAPPPSAEAILAGGVAGEARDGYARIPERPPSA